MALPLLLVSATHQYDLQRRLHLRLFRCSLGTRRLSGKMNKTKQQIENLLMPPAGYSAHQSGRGSTADCMVFGERPRTPEEIRKYRRSANLEPGKRFQNPKTVVDLETLQLEQKTFGVSSKRAEVTAATLLNQTPANGTVGKLNFKKAENIYYTTKREPLGQVYSRHHQLPQKFLEGMSPLCCPVRACPSSFSPFLRRAIWSIDERTRGDSKIFIISQDN
jgi:hypothetical protein